MIKQHVTEVYNYTDHSAHSFLVPSFELFAKGKGALIVFQLLVSPNTATLLLITRYLKEIDTQRIVHAVGLYIKASYNNHRF